jgi:hypothetical protein
MPQCIISGRFRTDRCGRRLVLSVLVLLLLGGCTSMRTVQTPDPREAVKVLSVGDTVQVVMADSQKLRFRIAGIEEDYLVSTKGERVAIDDMRIVSVRRFDQGNSAVATYGTLVLGVAVAAIILYAGF